MCRFAGNTKDRFSRVAAHIIKECKHGVGTDKNKSCFHSLRFLFIMYNNVKRFASN